ncbi:SEC [Symbiodinium necroappetens]|uniref:SEC protein n=1 Tax=Symbiodinium necroappetens TaxID=1628268 RepID=A0A812Z1W0_9DINO|nr:SEC [Symbiodinium necroappetens]
MLWTVWFCYLIRALCVAVAEPQDVVLQRLRRGQSRAANATLLVGGLVRNAALHLPQLRQKIETLADHFRRVQIIFVENDSTDGTGKYLDHWSKTAAGKTTMRTIRLTLSQDTHIGPYKSRGELKAKGWGHDGVRLLARLRNKYLEEFRRETRGSAKEHWILMVDADVGMEWSASDLLEALGHEARWHALCAHTWYRSNSLYDAFALRGEGLQGLSPTDFEEQAGKSFFPHALCGLQKQWGEHCDCGMELQGQEKSCSSCAASVTARSLIPVDSCFGGLALYHEDLLHKFGSCRYDEGLDDCEHVALHSCMRSRGAIIVLYPRLAAQASAANTTCCVETCSQAEAFPMSFLPFQPQFSASGARVAGLLAAGMSLEEEGQLQAALEKYQEAARIPKDAGLALQRWAARAGLLGAFLLLQYKQADKALLMIRDRQGTQLLASKDPWAAMMVGHVHELLDDLGGAATWFENAIETWPTAPAMLRKAEEHQGAWIKARLSWLPATHGSEKEAINAIENFTTGLSALIVEEGAPLRGRGCGIPAAFDTRSVEMTRLTYLGPTLVPHLPEIASAFSRLHLRSLRNLGFEAAALQAPGGLRKSPEVRVGFVSGLFGDSAVGNLVRGIIWPLPKSVWVALLCLGSLQRKSPNSAAVAEALLERADHVEEASYWSSTSPGTPKELGRTRAAILKLRLDCLVFLEVGLDVRSFTLAHSRLAPLQMVTYGHASTTGIPTIDAFLSFEAFEPSEWLHAQSQYSEQLVLLKGFPFFLPSTDPEHAEKGTSTLRWASLLESSGTGTCALTKPSDRVYLVAQTLYKLVPAFDKALEGILKADPGPEAVLAIRVGHPQPQIHRRIAARLALQLEPSQLARLCFVPMQNASTYFWMLKHASVILDTFPHGGHTTTLDALSAGAPVVTLKGQHLAGGFAAGFLRTLFEKSLPDVRSCCLALTVSDYVKKAVLLASNPDYSERVGSWIRETALARVFHRRDGAEALAELLLAVSGKPQEEGDQKKLDDRSEPLAPYHQVQEATLSAYLHDPRQFTWGILPLVLRPRSWRQVQPADKAAASAVQHRAIWPMRMKGSQSSEFPVARESFSTALAGHGGLAVAFCCAAISFPWLLFWAPQLRKSLQGFQSGTDEIRLGLAHAHHDSAVLSVLYLLTPDRQLGAVSLEFCVAELQKQQPGTLPVPLGSIEHVQTV